MTDRRWLYYALEMTIGLGVVVVIGCTFYVLLSSAHFEHSSLVFIGLPAVLALAAVLRPATAKGAIVRAITVALLLSSVLFGEGFVCIVRLDPAWYFAPLERYGVRLAAGYLIETLATPRDIGESGASR